MKRRSLSGIILIIALFQLFLSSCKKKTEEPAPVTIISPAPAPGGKDHLSGNNEVKYWQPVSIIEKTAYGGNNLYLTLQSCAVDNYIVFFDNGDYEERGFGTKCYTDERLIVNTFKWNLNGNALKVSGFSGGGIYEISSTLFSTEVTVTELTSTRFKGYRVKSAGDTIKFTLSAVPM